MRSSASGGAGREEERLVDSTEEEEEEQGRGLRRLDGWKKSPMDLEAAIGRCRRRSLATAATVGGKSVYVPNTNTMGQVITSNKAFYNYRIRNAGIYSVSVYLVSHVRKKKISC